MEPDTLSGESIQRDLGTRIIGRQVVYYPSVTSTNDIARQAAAGGAPEGTVIVAGEQTAARGRLKRTWLSPAGNLAFSYVLYPSAERLASLIMVASTAVVQAVKSITRLEATIKWPNDIQINGRKLCGILIENDIKGSRICSVTGIGINVNRQMDAVPGIDLPATCLARELGREVPLVALARRLLIELDALYRSSPAIVFEAWRSRLVTLGKTVRARTSDAVYEGVAESVAPDGSLALRIPGGGLVRIIAGDVTLRG